jgi:hypothetical protein
MKATTKQVLSWMLQLLLALSFLFSAFIRELGSKPKPSNILPPLASRLNL